MDNPIIFYDKTGNPINHFTQWDKNQTIYTDVPGLDAKSILPVIYFNNRNSASAFSVTSTYISKEKISVTVPNILFSEPETIVIRVYQYSNADSAKTTYTARIPVTRAKIPDEYEYIENYQLVSITDLASRISRLEAKVAALEKQLA